MRQGTKKYDQIYTIRFDLPTMISFRHCYLFVKKDHSLWLKSILIIIEIYF